MMLRVFANLLLIPIDCNKRKPLIDREVGRCVALKDKYGCFTQPQKEWCQKELCAPACGSSCPPFSSSTINGDCSPIAECSSRTPIGTYCGDVNSTLDQSPNHVCYLQADGKTCDTKCPNHYKDFRSAGLGCEPVGCKDRTPINDSCSLFDDSYQCYLQSDGVSCLAKAPTAFLIKGNKAFLIATIVLAGVVALSVTAVVVLVVLYVFKRKKENSL